LSFFYSVTAEDVPDNLFEKGHVFRIVQDAIFLVFGERLLLCHKNKKGFAIKTRRTGKSITVIEYFLRDRFGLLIRLYIRTPPKSVLSYQHNQKLPAKAAPRWCLRDAAAWCAMMDARKYALEAMMNGMPFVVVPETPGSKKRYERYVWMEKGEVLFSEEAALDHREVFGVWPRDNYFGEDPNEPFDD